MLHVLLSLALSVRGYIWKTDAAESISVSSCEMGTLTSPFIGTLGVCSNCVVGTRMEDVMGETVNHP